MPVIRVLVMLATMMMKLVWYRFCPLYFLVHHGFFSHSCRKDSIKKQIKKSDWICGNVKTADDYLKTHPNSWLNSAIGVVTITTMLMNVCFADDQSKKEVAETQKEAENARDRANKSGIELANSQIKAEQEKQKTSNIETNNQIKVEQEQQKTEQEQQKTEQEKQKTEQERQKTIKTQKDFIKYMEQNCKENHGQFFIEKGGTKASIGGIAIEVEAECKTPKPTKTNQTPIQPKHLPNSKQPRSQRGSKAQELIAYLQKELESLPYSQKAIAKQVD